MLMPSHAKAVQPYRDVQPIFARSGIEAQLDKMLQPQVTLKSGGYIIINQTEALVAIDVNSGRSNEVTFHRGYGAANQSRGRRRSPLVSCAFATLPALS